MRKFIIVTLLLLLAGCGTMKDTVTKSGVSKNEESKLLIEMKSLVKDKKYEDAYLKFLDQYKDGGTPTEQEEKYYDKVTLLYAENDIGRYLTTDEQTTLSDYIDSKTNEKIEELKENHINGIKNKIREIVREKNYKALDKLTSKKYIPQYKDDELQVMFAYVNFLSKTDGKNISEELYSTELDTLFKQIPIDYDGEYSKRLNELFNTQQTEPVEDDSVDTPKYNPQIGMTDEEVLESSWGAPSYKNTTITANGKSEQWVYPNSKYLYFEDGYLTSIQY